MFSIRLEFLKAWHKKNFYHQKWHSLFQSFQGREFAWLVTHAAPSKSATKFLHVMRNAFFNGKYCLNGILSKYPVTAKWDRSCSYEEIYPALPGRDIQTRSRFNRLFHWKIHFWLHVKTISSRLGCLFFRTKISLYKRGIPSFHVHSFFCKQHVLNSTSVLLNFFIN